MVCGKEDKYVKFYVVPSLFRRHFPEKYKSHRCHDILLLCISCHDKAGKYNDVFKGQIMEKY